MDRLRLPVERLSTLKKILFTVIFLIILLPFSPLKAQITYIYAGPDVSICPPDSAQLTSVVLPVDTGQYLYQWSPPIGISAANTTKPYPKVRPNSSTMYTLVIIDTVAHDTATDYVNVVILASIPDPVITSTPQGSPPCDNLPVTLSCSTYSNPNLYAFRWMKNGVIIPLATGTTYTTNQDGVYSLYVTSLSGGCQKTSNSITLDFIEGPNANHSYDESLIYCSGNTVDPIFFNNSTTSATNSFYNIVWGDLTSPFTSTTNWTSIQHPYAPGSQGYFNIIYTVTGPGPDFCTTSFTDQLFIGSVPKGSLVGPGESQDCAPVTFECVWSTTPANYNVFLNPKGTLYTLWFNESTDVQEIDQLDLDTVFPRTYNFSSCGYMDNSFVINWKIENPCGIRLGSVGSLLVSTLPQTKFEISSQHCTGTIITLTDKSDSANFIYYNSGLGTYECNDDYTLQWIISPATGWTLVSGTMTSPELTVNFNVPGMYEITLITTNGCGNDTLTKILCSDPHASSSFTVDTTTGCVPLIVHTTNTTDITTYCDQEARYRWEVFGLPNSCNTDYGDSYQFVPPTTQASEDPVIRFLKPGVYNLKLWVINGCDSAWSDTTITVKGPPNANLTTSPPSPPCTPRPYTPGIDIKDCFSPITSYKWDMHGGDPDTSNAAPPVTIQYDNPGNYNIMLVVENECGIDTVKQNFNLYPTPTVNDKNDTIVCAGASIPSYIFSGPVPGTTFTWTNSNTSIGLGASGNGNIPAFTATNTTNIPKVATITVTPKTSTCTGPTMTFTITVNPKPTITITPSTPQSKCHGDMSNTVNFTSNVTGTTLSWTSNIDIGNGTSGSGNILASFQVVNTTTAQVTANYSITPTFTNQGIGCSGNPGSLSISVKPQPIVNQKGSTVVCNGDLVPIMTFSGPVSGTAFSWTCSPNVGFGTSGTGDIPQFTANNITPSPIIATIIVTPKTTVGLTCYGPTMTFSITVNPKPGINPITIADLCNNQSSTPVTLTSPVSGSTFTWSCSPPGIGLGPGPITGNIIPSFTAINTGNVNIPATITITASFTNDGLTCSGTPLIKNFNVKPIPKVNSIPDQDFCISPPLRDPVNFTSTVSGTSYSWMNSNVSIGLSAGSTGDLPNFSATNTGTSLISGTITVTPTANGCLGPDSTFIINVFPNPTVTQVPNQILCHDATQPGITFSGPVAGTSYTWSNNTPSIGLAASGTGDMPSFPAVNTTNAPVTATITVTPKANGCNGTPMIYTITVNPIPTVIPFSGPYYCNEDLTPVISFSSLVNGTTFTWTNNNTSIGLGSGGSGALPSFAASNSILVPIMGTVTVVPTANACVGNGFSFNITVNPTPAVDPVSDQTLCTGALTNPVVFTGNMALNTYNWTNSVPAIGLAASGSGDIASFTANNAGGSPAEALITVTPLYFNIVTCPGTPITFTIKVLNSIPDQVFCHLDNTNPVVFTGLNPATDYTWTNDVTSIGLGGGGTGNLPVFTANNPGNAPVTATITVTPPDAICGNTNGTFLFIINPKPTVDDVADQVKCNGQATDPVVFTGNMSNTAYEWVATGPSIGLPSNSGTGDLSSFTPVNTGTTPLVVTLTVTPIANNCTGEPITFTYTINPTPTVTAITDKVYCNNVLTTSIPLPGTVIGSTFSWTNNNTNIGLIANGTMLIPSFVTTNTTNAPIAGTITVTPIANGCIGPDLTFTITVNPTPTVNAISNVSYCNGATTALIPVSGPVSGTTFAWVNNTPSIGLDASGTGDIPVFTATNPTSNPVTAMVTITPTANGCTGTPLSFQIMVNPTPKANAGPDQSVPNGWAATLNGSASYSPGPFSYLWSPAGMISGSPNNQNVLTVGITAPATFCLTVTDQNTNCSSLPDCMNVTLSSGVLNITVPDKTICLGDPPFTLNPVASGGNPGTYSYIWSSNPPSPPLSGPNPSISPSPAVTTTYSVTLTDGISTFTDVATVTVNPIPDVTPVPSNIVVCNNTSVPVTYLTGSVAGTVFSWSNSNTGIGLTGSGTGNIPSFTATNTGNSPKVATITITPTYTFNGVTCTGTTQYFTITVNPTPTVDPVTNQVWCNTNTTTPINLGSPVAGTTFAWTNSNTSIGLASPGIGNIPSFTATNTGVAPISGTIAVTPTYTNQVACTGPAMNFTITVNPTPTVTAVSNISICNGATQPAITFASPVTGTTFSWTNSTPSIGLAAGPLTGNLPSFTATNTTTANVIATINVTPTYTNAGKSCPGTVMTFTITVKPTPSATTVTNQSYCNGISTVATSFTGPVAGTSFTWANSNTAIGLGASGTAAIPVFTTTNATNAPIFGTITVTPTAAGCTGSNMVFTITVNPSATANQVNNKEVCNATIVPAITFTGPVTGTTWPWTNSDPTIGLGGSGTGNIPSFTAVNNSSVPVVATITVIPKANGCNGTPMIFTITVNPGPSMNPVSSITLCPGIPTTIPLTGPVAGTIFNWTNTNPNIGVSASGTGDIIFTSSNTTNAPISGTINVTPVFTGGTNSCPGAQVSFTITVNPLPTANQVSDTVVCNLDPVTPITFSGNIPSATYPWTNNQPSIMGGTSTGTDVVPFFWATNGNPSPVVATIAVTPTYTNLITCTGPLMNFKITVLPSPDLQNPVNAVYCHNATTTPIVFTSSDPGTTYSWTNDNTSIGLGAGGSGNVPSFIPLNTSLSPVSATVSVTPTYVVSTVSCSGPPESFTITVNPVPLIGPVSNQSYCNGNTTNVINFNASVTGTQFTWTNDNNASLIPLSGIVNIPPTLVTNNQTSPIVSNIVVTPVFTNAGVSCPGIPGNFTITVNPSPTVDFIGNMTFNHGDITPIIPITGSIAGTTYNWTNDNPFIGLGLGASGNIPSFIANNTGADPLIGTITVSPVNGSCTGPPLTFTITVNPIPAVNNLPNVSVCNGQWTNPISFTGTPSGVIFNWSNGNTTIGLMAGGSGTIPSFQAVNNSNVPKVATITVTPTLPGFSGVPKTFTITVYPTPSVSPAIPNIVRCDGQVNPAFYITGPVNNTNFSWSYVSPLVGLPTSGVTYVPSFTALNPSTSTINTTVTIQPLANGCQGPASTFTITVKPTPHVNFIADQVRCSNTFTSSVNLTSAVTGTTFTWTNDQPDIGLPSGTSTTSFIPAFLTNTLTSLTTGTITITPAANSCVGPDSSFQISVIPYTSVDPVLDTAFCHNETAGPILFTSPTPGTTFSWYNQVSAIGLINGPQTGDIPPFTATNSSNVPVFSNVTVTPLYTYQNLTCPGQLRNFTLIVNPIPSIVNVLPDLNYCNNQIAPDINLTGSVLGTTFNWTNSNTSIGLYSPGTGNIPSFTATNIGTTPISGVITVTPKYASCNGIDKVFSIYVHPNPVIGTIYNQVVCNKASTLAVNFTSNLSGTTFSWINDNPTIGLAANGSGNTIASFVAVNNGLLPVVATITVTALKSGCTTTLSFTITVNPTPVANAGPDQTIFYGTTTNLSGSASPASCTYSWTPVNMLNGPPTLYNPQTVNLTSTQSYILEVTNPTTTCKSRKDTMVVTVVGGPLSLNVLAQPGTICQGSSSQLTAVSSGGSHLYTYSWSPTGTLSNFTVNNPVATPLVTTVYTVTVSDGYNTVSQSVTVNVTQPPAAWAGNDTLICSNQQLFINNWSTASNYSSLIWSSSGTGGFSPSNTLNTTYTPSLADIGQGLVELRLTAHGLSPCGDSTHSFFLTIAPQTEANAGPDTNLCAGQSLDLTLASALYANSFQWSTSGSGTFSNSNSLNPSYTPSTDDVSLGMITLTLQASSSTLACGEDSDEMILWIHPLPDVYAGSDDSICEGDSIHLQAVSANAIAYIWDNVFTINSYQIADPWASPTTTTLYHVTVTDLNQCTRTDDVLIKVNPRPPAEAGPNINLCIGDSIQLQASGGIDYQWSNAPGLNAYNIPNPWANPITSTWYYLTVTDEHTCHAKDSILISVRPLPLIMIYSPEDKICEGNTIELVASGAYTYSWTPFNTLSSPFGQTVTAFPDMPTTYTVTGTSIYGCENNASIFIDVVPLPVVNLGNSSDYCLGDPVLLHAGYNDTIDYIWQDGSHGQYYNVILAGLYWVVADNGYCSVSDTVYIGYCTEVWIPNAFTPGEDALNSYFLAKASTELKEFKIQIFNRWGDLIFESNDIRKGWDGTFKGDVCPVDVYVYKCSYLGMSSDKEVVKYGTVTLVQ